MLSYNSLLSTLSHPKKRHVLTSCEVKPFNIFCLTDATDQEVVTSVCAKQKMELILSGAHCPEKNSRGGGGGDSNLTNQIRMRKNGNIFGTD